MARKVKHAAPAKKANRATLDRELTEEDVQKIAGTGTLDMIARCRTAGLPEPTFRQDRGQFVQAFQRPKESAAPHVTAEVTAEVRLVQVLSGPMTRDEIKQALNMKHDEHFRKAYLVPALEQGLIEMTIPDKPRSSRQKYRLTATGRRLKVGAG